MFSIDSKNGIIVCNRGDSFEFPVFINIGTPLEPVRYGLIGNPDSTLYLGVCEPNKKFEDAIIKKKYTGMDFMNFNSNKDLIVKFAPEDTENLTPGLYYYEIKLTTKVDEYRLNLDLKIIDNTSVLKKGTLLSDKCIINGTLVRVPTGAEFYEITADTTLLMNDVIRANSIIKSGSKIDGTEFKDSTQVDTIVQKTKFIIEE